MNIQVYRKGKQGFVEECGFDIFRINQCLHACNEIFEI